MAKLSKPQREKLHAKAMRDWDNIYSVEQFQRRLMNEDTLVANVQGGTWIDGTLDSNGGSFLDGNDYRDYEDSPRFSVNKISYELQKSNGTYLLMRSDIDVKPNGGGATKDGAEAYKAIIKSIEDRSDANNAFDTAYTGNQTCGLGAWQIRTEYKEDSIDKLECWIDAIADPVNTLFFDARSTPQILNQDAEHCFYVEHISHDEHKRRWPRAEISSFAKISDLAEGSTIGSFWYTTNTVAIAKYWYKEKVIRHKVQLIEDDRVVEVTKAEAQLLIEEGLVATRSDGRPLKRTVETDVVRMAIINGLEVLEGAFDFPSKHFPYFPSYGIITTLQGTNYIRGRVRLAKDAQRINDYSLSKLVETAAMTPEQPIVFFDGQIDGQEESWERQPLPAVLKANWEEGMPAPYRMSPAHSDQTLFNQVQMSHNEIQAAMGVVSDEAMLNISGKSYREQLATTNLGTAVNRENQRKARALCASVLIDMIPKVYDYNEIISYTDDEGVEQNVEINKPMLDPETAEETVFNDIRKGNYKAEAIAGVSKASQNAELSESLNLMTVNNPALGNVISDIQAELLDAPLYIKNKLEKRVKTFMAQQGTYQPTPEEAEEMGIDLNAIAQQRQATEQANRAYLESQTAINKSIVMKNTEEAHNRAADTDYKVTNNQKLMTDLRYKLLESIVIKLDHGIPLTENDLLSIQMSSEILLDDFSDSFEERQQLTAQLQNAMMMMQSQQAAQTQAPAAPNAAQNVQAIQIDRASY